MLTIFSFLITLIGGINWLMIGLLQYDFIAGIFGYQASVFSRLIYIVFGLSGIILLFKLFKGRGTIAVFSRRNKKDLKENMDKIGEKSSSPAHANVESAREFENKQNFNTQQKNPSAEFEHSPYYDQKNRDYDYYQDLDAPHSSNENDGLFDEHLGRR